MSTPGTADSPGSAGPAGSRLPDLAGPAGGLDDAGSWASFGGGGDLGPAGGPPVPSAAMMEALVDAVVDRIEQRVVDELERRGRRQSWGTH